VTSINQSIKTHFYSAVCRERIRGAKTCQKTWPILKSQSCTLSAFPQWSLPAWRWGNSTHQETWPVATASYHRPNHSSEFRIGSCQCQKTWLYQKQMSINFFHTISVLTTIILVHVNNGSYTHDDVVNIWP